MHLSLGGNDIFLKLLNYEKFNNLYTNTENNYQDLTDNSTSHTSGNYFYPYYYLYN